MIEFLKFHDGIPPVFQFNLRWTVFTFYWAHSSTGELTNESKLKIAFFDAKNIQSRWNVFKLGPDLFIGSTRCAGTL